jgi:hypothetical protein
METIYDQFIKHCSSIESQEVKSGIYMEKHHIVPRHCGEVMRKLTSYFSPEKITS